MEISSPRIRAYSIAICALVIIHSIEATAAAPTIISYTEPQAKTIIVQHKVPFEARTYTPPYNVRIISNEAQASYDTPEAALSAYFSAAALSDRAWGFRTLDKDSNARLRAKKTTDPSAYENDLREGMSFGETMFTKGTAILLEQAEVSDLTVILTELVDKKTGKVEIRLPFLVRKDNGKWKVNDGVGLPVDTRLAIYTYYPVGRDSVRVNRGYGLRTPPPVDSSFQLDNPPNVSGR
ncbi:MAG: hypothetical protein ACE10A_03615 [Acidiferrobacterales bacterium]